MFSALVKTADIGVLFTDTLTAAGVNFANVSSAKFLLRSDDGLVALSKTATTSNPTVGSCDISYTTQTGDLATAGGYSQEWELTFSGGPVLTFPSDGYNRVVVLDDLN